jgi:hypothetical protein
MVDINDFFFDDEIRNTDDLKPIDRLEQILPKCDIFPTVKINKPKERREEKSKNLKIEYKKNYE